MTQRACLDGKNLITPQPKAQKKSITLPLLNFYNQKELYYIHSNSGRAVEATPKIEKLLITRTLATIPKNRTKILQKIMQKCSQDKNLKL